MKNWNGVVRRSAELFLTTALALGAPCAVFAQSSPAAKPSAGAELMGRFQPPVKVLYIWAQDEAHVAPDFLAVIDFDEQSSKYGQVINVVPVPPPGNIGNEPHHCHLNVNKTILG